MMNRALRLAIVMPSFFEQLAGGAEYQAYLLSEYAKLSKIDVHYVFADNGSPYKNALGINLYPLKRIRIRKTFGSILSLYYTTILQNLKIICPDVLYVRGGWSWAAMTARYAEQHHCRSIWHIASSQDVTPKPYKAYIKRPFDFLEDKAIEYAIRHSTHVISHARFLDELLKKHYGRKSKVILAGHPESKEILIKKKKFTVVWVANMKPIKQPEIFVRLASEFYENTNMRFVMIGRPNSCNFQTILESKINKVSNLDYIGEQPIDKVNSILAESHVLVNTSTYEGLPNTFVQAWMREVPVVSMLLDPDDIIRSQKIGYLSGSFHQMVLDIKKLYVNPSLRDEIGKRARKYALANHSLEKNMTQIIELIKAQ